MSALVQSNVKGLEHTVVGNPHSLKSFKETLCNSLIPLLFNPAVNREAFGRVSWPDVQTGICRWTDRYLLGMDEVVVVSAEWQGGDSAAIVVTLIAMVARNIPDPLKKKITQIKFLSTQ